MTGLRRIAGPYDMRFARCLSALCLAKIHPEVCITHLMLQHPTRKCSHRLLRDSCHITVVLSSFFACSPTRDIHKAAGGHPLRQFDGFTDTFAAPFDALDRTCFRMLLACTFGSRLSVSEADSASATDSPLFQVDYSQPGPDIPCA